MDERRHLHECRRRVRVRHRGERGQHDADAGLARPLPHARADQRQLWDVRSTARDAARGPTSSTRARTAATPAIGRLGQYNTALWHRYGHWSGLASYEREAQAAGYEVARAQFEAYIGQAHDRANPSTGLIYWQLNKAWPSLQWQLVRLRLRPVGRRTSGRRRRTSRCTSCTPTTDGSIRVVEPDERAASAGCVRASSSGAIDGGRRGRAHRGGAPAAGPGRADRAPARASRRGMSLDVLPRARR